MHDEYLVFARSRIDALARLAEGYAGTGLGDVAVPLGDASIRLARPIQVRDAEGLTRLRFVNLKRPSADHVKGLATRLLASAAHAVAGGACSVEVAFIEGGVDPVVRTPVQRVADIGEAEEVLAAIRSGDLPHKPNLRTCLRCGHFHSCPATGGDRAGASSAES